MTDPPGPRIDLNADVGESYGTWTLGDDEGLLAVISSANVACGAHAGDASTMRRCCELAVQHGVRVGAQVGYRDLAGFGRRFVDVVPDTLRDDVVVQIGALQAAARVAGTQVAYVKPHGALYHAAGHHREQATAIVAAVASYDPTLAVVGPPGSVLLVLAERAGLATQVEAFADRGYLGDGTLAPRGTPGALLTDPDAVAARAVCLVREHHVRALDASLVPLRPDTLCLHGDTPGAAALAGRVRAALESAGVTIG